MNYDADGWVAHQVSDIWVKTSPDRGEAVWALWPMGGAWLCTHLWEHYTYTMDKVSSVFSVNYSDIYDLKSFIQNSSCIKSSVGGVVYFNSHRVVTSAHVGL